MALDKGANIGQHVSWMIKCIGNTLKLKIPIQIFIDNRGAQILASNPIAPDRNLHIHARYFYVRGLVENSEYVIEHLGTNEMVADILCTFKGTSSFMYLFHVSLSCISICFC